MGLIPWVQFVFQISSQDQAEHRVLSPHLCLPPSSSSEVTPSITTFPILTSPSTFMEPDPRWLILPKSPWNGCTNWCCEGEAWRLRKRKPSKSWGRGMGDRGKGFEMKELCTFSKLKESQSGWSLGNKRKRMILVELEDICRSETSRPHRLV